MQDNTIPEDSETLEELCERYVKGNRNFVAREALKIYYWTDNAETKLHALEILRSTSLNW